MVAGTAVFGEVGWRVVPRFFCCMISIGQSNRAKKRESNRSSDWTVGLVTDPIDQSKHALQYDCTRLLGCTKSLIRSADWPIQHTGLTPIRSDRSIGPTKSQPNNDDEVPVAEILSPEEHLGLRHLHHMHCNAKKQLKPAQQPLELDSNDDDKVPSTFPPRSVLKNPEFSLGKAQLILIKTSLRTNHQKKMTYLCHKSRSKLSRKEKTFQNSCDFHHFIPFV